MLRPYLVDPSSATEIARWPREGDVVVLPPDDDDDAVEGPALLVLAPAEGGCVLVPLGRGFAASPLGLTVEADDLSSDVIEAPVEAALDAARPGVALPRCARVAGRVTRSVTDALRRALGLAPFVSPPPPPVTADEAGELLEALGVYPDDFAFFRLDDDERARCALLVARLCVAMRFDRLAGVRFGMVGAVAGVVLGRDEACGAPEHLELLWFAEGVDELEARNAARPPELRAALVRDGQLTVAVYPDVPDAVRLVAAG